MPKREPKDGSEPRAPRRRAGSDSDTRPDAGGAAEAPALAEDVQRRLSGAEPPADAVEAAARIAEGDELGDDAPPAPSEPWAEIIDPYLKIGLTWMAKKSSDFQTSDEDRQALLSGPWGALLDKWDEKLPGGLKAWTPELAAIGCTMIWIDAVLDRRDARKEAERVSQARSAEVVEDAA